MPEDHGLLQAILTDPDDDLPRLAYADWLDEHDDSARAEFIRTQCELARTEPDDPRWERLETRAKALEKAGAPEWLRPLRKAFNRPRCRQLWRGGCSFQRGFLESLGLIPQRPDFLSATGTALATLPLQSLSLTGTETFGIDQALPDLVRVPHLTCLRSLDGCGCGPLSAETLRMVASAPNLPRLTGLSLSFDEGATAISGLIETSLAERLHSLSLIIGPGLLEVLTADLRLPALNSLALYDYRLGNYGFGDRGLERLSHSPNLPSLRGLHMYDRTTTATGLASLFRSPLGGRLRSLFLSHAPIGDTVIPELVRALRGELRNLTLAYVGLTAAAALALAAAPSWGALESLALDGNAFGDEGAIALAASPHLARLWRLSMYGSGLTDAGVRALAASPHAGGLRQLRLYEGGLSLGARRALSKRFGRRFVFGLT